MVTPRNLSPDARAVVTRVPGLVTKSSGLATTLLHLSNARRYKIRRVNIRVIQAFDTNAVNIALTSSGGITFGTFNIPINAAASANFTFENFTNDEIPAGDTLLAAQNSIAGNGTYYWSVELYPMDDNNRGV